MPKVYEPIVANLGEMTALTRAEAPGGPAA
jgi:hypothetical protein